MTVVVVVAVVAVATAVMDTTSVPVAMAVFVFAFPFHPASSTIVHRLLSRLLVHRLDGHAPIQTFAHCPFPPPSTTGAATGGKAAADAVVAQLAVG